MVTDQEIKSCRRDGCDVVTTGVCLEGFDPLQSCPHLSGSVSGLPELEGKSDPGIANVALSEGETLSVIEAENVMRAQSTGVVVVGGWTGSGKTTLITSIYESFLVAPFAGQIFAGSLTLPGFEEACHEGRMASEGESATTPRTNPRLGIRFYHLNLVAQLGGERCQLLIADMSGELLREACNSSEDASKLHVIQRADRFVLLLDGKKLMGASERHIAFNDARLILRSLLEEKLIGRWTRVDVVFAKWDVIQLGDDAPRDFIAMIQREILSRFERSVARFKFFSVAARPETKDSPFAFGVPDLFREWIERDPPACSPPKVPRIDIKCNREFARFACCVETEGKDS